MKKIYLLLSFFLITVGAVQAQTCRIKSDTSYYNDGTNTYLNLDHYIYDGSNVLRRIDKYSDYMSSLFLYSYDSVYYSASNEVDSVINFDVTSNLPTGTAIRNTWSMGMITRQISVNVESSSIRRDTTTFSYSGSVLNSVTQSSWTDNTQDNYMEITGIVFNNGNMTNGSLGGIPVTITYDSYPNPFYGLYVVDDFLENISTNNALSAAPDASPSSTFFSKSYTYSSNRLATAYEDFGDGTSKWDDYDYYCDVATGITNSATASEVDFYPNPSADGQFRLENNKASFDQVTVTNNTGQVVRQYSVPAADLTIDLSGMPAGVYNVKLTGANTVSYSKLVKQ